jgi:hypothetical protein
MKLVEIICHKIARFFKKAMVERIMILQGMVLYPRCFSFSIRPDTRSRAAIVASISCSIPITTMSPSRHPLGRSESGRENRTDSSSWAISTARGLSIRSMVALILTHHYDFWSMIVPLPSLSVATSPLLLQIGVSRPIKRAVSFMFPFPE